MGQILGSSVYGDKIATEKVQLTAEEGELPAHLTDRLEIVPSKVGDCFAEGPGQGSGRGSPGRCNRLGLQGKGSSDLD